MTRGLTCALSRVQPGLLRLVCLVALAASLAAAGTAAGAAPGNQSGEFQPKARHAFLMDAESGAIMYQHKADEPVPPASMSKLMTLAVLFRAMKDGKLRGSDEFQVSEGAWRRGGAPSGTSAMMMPLGSKVRLDEIIQGIIVQSGNDAAIVVAEGMAGTEDAFSKLMAEEGRRIGLRHSTFKNSTGLYHPDHLMSARDLGILARFLIREYPEHYPIFAQREYPYRKHKFINRNPLLYANAGVDGLKTGFIKEAGYGMVASAKQGERRLIAVVNGLATAEERKEEARRLLEWGFRSFTEVKIFDAGEVVGEARVWGGTRFFVPLIGQGEIAVVLPRFPANQRLKAEILYQGPLKPPISRGDPVARLRVTSSTNAVNELQLYAAEDVAPGGIWRRGLDSLAHLALRWVP
jgi:D-alanyl-D-alanine carboxypeptidase (penicillin-binding protein 5/6)